MSEPELMHYMLFKRDLTPGAHARRVPVAGWRQPTRIDPQQVFSIVARLTKVEEGWHARPRECNVGDRPEAVSFLIWQGADPREYYELVWVEGVQRAFEMMRGYVELTMDAEPIFFGVKDVTSPPLLPQ